MNRQQPLFAIDKIIAIIVALTVLATALVGTAHADVKNVWIGVNGAT